MVFSDIIGTLSFLQPGLDDDFLDRLNYYHTSTFLIVIALVVSFKMLAGRPLECWVPAEYTGSWEDYSEVFCWAQNTYFVPFESHIPKDIAEREFSHVSYYQWFPFFMLITALLFYFPCILWRVFSSKSGVVLNDIVAVAKDKANITHETREANVRGLAEHLLSVFRHQFRIKKRTGLRRQPSSLHRVARCFNLRYYEAYMISLYLFIKLLYLSNSLGQLFLMNKFLQTDDYGIYGVGVLRDLFYGKGWKESGNFPRVTMCDMQIRVLGNVQRHTVQCVLVINIFTEKIFVLLWIWYTLLSLLNLFSFLYWISISLPRNERLRYYFGSSSPLSMSVRFVARQLELADSEFQPNEHREELKRFVSGWIKIDGIFVLRILTMQSGLMLTMELIDYMWEKFLREQNDRHKRFDQKFPPSFDMKESELLHQGGPSAPLRHVTLGIDEVDGSAEVKDKPPNFHMGEDEKDPEAQTDHEGGAFIPLPLPSVSEDGMNEPSPRRKTSVFIPLVLPRTERNRLPPPASSYRRQRFMRSSSTFR